MHEARTAQCLRIFKMESPIRLIAISEYGLISLYAASIGIRILTLNGNLFIEHKPKSALKCMKFTKSGDFLLYSSNTTFCFFDITEPDKIQARIIEDENSFNNYEIDTFCTSANNEYFTIISSVFNEFKITTLGKLKERRLMHLS